MKGITNDWNQEAEVILEYFPQQQVTAMQNQFPKEEANHSQGQFSRFYLNARPDPIDHRDLLYEPSLVEIKSLLYPQQETLDDLTIRNQGVEGSCTGQALAAVIDLQNLKRWQQGAEVPKRVSARMAYENAKLYDAYPDDGLQGSSIRGAIKGFYHHGICNGAHAPYFDGDIGWKITQEIEQDSRAVVLGAYFRLRRVLNHFHSAISEVGAILCSAAIHDGWLPESVAASDGRIIFHKPSDEQVGGTMSSTLRGLHAFTIVGYDSYGFLVLNSWGRGWGNFNPHQSSGTSCSPKRQSYFKQLGICDQGMPGIAHWSYDDWAEHIVDAWVLRLTAPTRKDAWYSGIYHVSQPNQINPLANQQTPRSRHVMGHYIHLRNGYLVEEPPYHNTLGTFDHTEALLERFQAEQQGKHLLFYAHGGLDTIESASARAAIFTKTFKANGIYPLFYFWRTGFGNIVQEILRGMYEKIEDRAQNNLQIIDHLLERQSESVGRAIWRDLLVNAQNCFATPSAQHNKGFLTTKHSTRENPFGAGWAVTHKLLKKNNKLSTPMKVHYVAHSAGVFMLGELFRSMMEEKGFPLENSIESVSLMAPACTTEYFLDAFLPLLQKHPTVSINIYNLPDTAERSIDPEIQPYNKSLLYLVSNAFEDVRGTAIAGLDRSWDDEFKDKFDGRINYTVIDEDFTIEVMRHSQFDNCADVMNDLLSKITLDRIADSKKFNAEELEHGKF